MRAVLSLFLIMIIIYQALLPMNTYLVTSKLQRYKVSVVESKRAIEEPDTWSAIKWMKGVKISQPISISPRAIWHPQPPQLPEVYLSAIYMYLAFDGSYVRNDYVRGVEDAINNFLSDGGENLMLAVLIDYPSGFDVSAKLIVKLRDSSGHLHIRVLTKNEINMGDPNTLVNFITEANNIAEDLIGRPIIVTRSVLYINGHGGEIMGTAQDWTPSDFLTPKELRQALQNTMHFNIIYLHSCYEGFFEMAYDLRDLADYALWTN